jgi:hypothetical protein
MFKTEPHFAIDKTFCTQERARERTTDYSNSTHILLEAFKSGVKEHSRDAWMWWIVFPTTEEVTIQYWALKEGSHKRTDI